MKYISHFVSHSMVYIISMVLRQSPFLAGDLDCFVSHSSWISMELHLVAPAAGTMGLHLGENGGS